MDFFNFVWKNKFLFLGLIILLSIPSIITGDPMFFIAMSTIIVIKLFFVLKWGKQNG